MPDEVTPDAKRSSGINLLGLWWLIPGQRRRH